MRLGRFGLWGLCRLLMRLHFLCLCCVFLFQLLRLLLVLLLHLLFFRLAGVALGQLLVLFFLLLLQLLVILGLFGDQTVLLLLILLVGFGVASVRGRSFVRFEIAGVCGRSWTRGDGCRFFLGLRVGSYCFFRWLSSRFFCGLFLVGCCVFVHCFGPICSRGRITVIHGSAQFRVGTSFLSTRILCSDWRYVAFATGSFFLRSCASFHAALAAVVADAGVTLHHSGVVGIVNHGGVHAIHRSVVSEAAIIPASALIPATTVSVAIIDAAVKTDILAPVAFMERIGIAAPAPIAGRPKEANLWRLYPVATHPVIAVVAISPITGGPEIAVGGTNRLLVDGHRRWRDDDRNAELAERGSRHRQ